MSGLAAELLARPGFGDRARYALLTLAERADEAVSAIGAAEARIADGEGAQRVAFDLVAAHSGVEMAAIFGELEAPDAAYLWGALDLDAQARAASKAVVAALAEAPRVGEGLRLTVPSLADLRVIGEVEIDFGAFEVQWSREEPWDEPVEFDPVRPLSATGGTTLEDLALAVGSALRKIGWDIHFLERHLGRRDGLSKTSGPLPESQIVRVVVEREPCADGRAFGQVIEGRVTRHFQSLGLSPARAVALARLVRIRASRCGYFNTPENTPEGRVWHAVTSPVMGQTFGLCQIYQPLRARTSLPGQAGAGATKGQPDERRWRLVVADDDLDRWAEASQADDTLRVVSGGPGAGKSSLARMFAARCWQRGIPALFIPLHDFDLDDDLIRAINTYARQHAGWDTVPLPPVEGLPPVLIFDGLDELAAGGRAARAAVATLFDGVERLLRVHNTDAVRLRALLLGREVVVQAHEARCRRPGQVLHLLPYRIPDGMQKRLDDPDGLAERDQRHDWWRRYGELVGEPLEGMPPELERPSLDDVTAQPLLNLLVALAREDGRLKLDDPSIGLPAIYADLVRQVFERTHSPSGRLHGVAAVSLDDYMQFLEAVAVAAWHGKGRTASTAEIEAVAGRRLLTKMDALRKGAEEGISQLVTAFYFRKAGESEQGGVFEFTHQSFAEALLARRIVRFLGQLERQAQRWEEDDGGWDPTERLVEWYRLFGPAPLDPNALAFVEMEVSAAGAEAAAGWRAVLLPMLHRVIVGDWPIEAAGPREAFAVEVRRSRHASAALLALVGVMAEVLQAHTPVGDVWPAFESWWSALRRNGSLDPVLSAGTRRLDFVRTDGVGFELRADFGELDVSHSRWGPVEMMGDLRGAWLEGADFRGTFLEDAQMSDAYADTSTRWPEGFDPAAAGVQLSSSASPSTPAPAGAPGGGAGGSRSAGRRR